MDPTHRHSVDKEKKNLLENNPSSCKGGGNAHCEKDDVFHQIQK
ncbi:hypothetical protein CP03DC29_0533 [Chlamydia psittaci 03DC29]|nr:hypothetical protein CP03DC29_0533 [Chlamydia psittaci 03DC29]